MKLELGCGERPTHGYIHNDLNPFPGVDLVGNAWEVALPDSSVEEVVALGMVEHLTYTHAHTLFVNTYRMLTPGGLFLFDVPDIPVWCGYVVDHFAGHQIPFTIDHVFSTLYGWQRWPGDEHNSGWHKGMIESDLRAAGFTNIRYGVDPFLQRGLCRRRMTRPTDAHLYVEARK